MRFVLIIIVADYEEFYPEGLVFRAFFLFDRAFFAPFNYAALFCINFGRGISILTLSLIRRFL